MYHQRLQGILQMHLYIFNLSYVFLHGQGYYAHVKVFHTKLIA